MTIFVQIASYRDPELLPTLRDMLSMADHPEALKICIAWQHHPDDAEWDTLLKEYSNDDRFVIIDIDAKETQGACWARNQIQQRYTDETYTLQLDSHHRFVKGWDTLLIDMLEKLVVKGFKKPVLTSYLPSYDPANDPASRAQMPSRIHFDKFNADGFLSTIPGYFQSSAPIRARFYSAHFTFAQGHFCREVMHDPNLYFAGEEPTIAVRAFTKGYDLFHPHVLVAWHEYTRKNRRKHWDDNTKWHEMDGSSKKRMRSLLGMSDDSIDFGEYGLGTQRTLQDYEDYAGVYFKSKTVSLYTKEFKEPPNPRCSEASTYYLKWMLDTPSSILEQKQDISFLATIIESAAGESIFRKDLRGDQIRERVVFDYIGTQEPKKWILWPHSSANQWLASFEGDFTTNSR